MYFIQKVSVWSGRVCTTTSPDSLIKSCNLVTSWVWRNFIDFVKSCFWLILIHVGLLVNSAHVLSSITACVYLDSAHSGFYCPRFSFNLRVAHPGRVSACRPAERAEIKIRSLKWRRGRVKERERERGSNKERGERQRRWEEEERERELKRVKSARQQGQISPAP